MPRRDNLRLSSGACYEKSQRRRCIDRGRCGSCFNSIHHRYLWLLRSQASKHRPPLSPWISYRHFAQGLSYCRQIAAVPRTIICNLLMLCGYISTQRWLECTRMPEHPRATPSRMSQSALPLASTCHRVRSSKSVQLPLVHSPAVWLH